MQVFWTNRGTSEGPDISELEYSMRRIQSKINFTQIVKTDLESSRQEFSNGGLGIVAALLVCSQIDFCRLILEVQSSYKPNLTF